MSHHEAHKHSGNHEFTRIVLDHARHPRNVGEIRNPDGFGSMTRECGDTLQIWLRVRNGKIEAARFLTNGCGTVIAAGSMVTELATGENVVDAAKIREEHIIEAFGGLPEESAHCATLAANTLNQAIRDYLAYKNDPWKRTYRK
ncbi:MAG: iron-sulfur cluster assembly scaffold protein [Dehalococcoidia bacterium]|nr:iron-sulfur cluster assembly scaffold protein [Dehalococcoidia bacterium]